VRPRGTIRTFAKPRVRWVVVSMAAIVALILGTVSTSAATAAPKGGEPDTKAADDTSPAVDGLYQPCSANFGLGKVVEIVVEVDGSVPTPPLTYPADVNVVTTFQSSSLPVTCTPEPVTDTLWANHLPWALLGVKAPVGNYVFLPFDTPLDSCTQSQTLRLVGHPSGYTVKVGSAIVPPTPGLLCGPSSVDTVNTVAEAIMSPAAFTALTAYNNDSSSCNTVPSADLQSAADALEGALKGQFLTLFQDASAGATPCDTVGDAYNWFAYQTLYDLEVGRQAVFKLTTPPAPTTTTPPTTTTTPVAAPASAPAAVVVAPAFTG
jgi:hypothetical protein